MPPGSGQVVHYRFKVPQDAQEKINVSVKLQYRKFDAKYMSYVYPNKSENDLPITLMSSDKVTFPVDGNPTIGQVPDKPEWQRWNDYGIGLLLKGDKGSEKGELIAARLSAVGAVMLAAYFGINPPGFVAATVALAFGLAAASFFPAIVMGIFSKKMNMEGAIAGMVVGILLMLFYMTKFKFGWFGGGTEKDWWFGISPEGFGSFAMLVNFVVSITISKFTPEPDSEIQKLVENIRNPDED